MRNRLVYVYASGLDSELVETVRSNGTALEHALGASTGNLFAKQYVLLKGAAELSQKTALSVGQAFVSRGQGRYFFDDSRVSSEIFAALKLAEAEMEFLLRQSA